MSSSPRAYVHRISPSGVDRVEEAVEEDVLILGWSKAPELLSRELGWGEFRQIIRDRYHPDDSNWRKAGAAAGHARRFLRDMKQDDLVVVPHGPTFYVARVIGDPYHLPEKAEDDTAFRRQVEWLNEKRPIPRSLARSALLSRLKNYGTCADASDLVEEILECLDLAASGERPSFATDLRERLIASTLKEIQSGRLDSFGFERLVADVMVKLGASDAKIVGRRIDKGADILASFLVAGAFQMVVAVQAKHYQPEPPVGPSAVNELISGIEEESASLGLVVTSGTFSDEAAAVAQQYSAETGVRIELVDGRQLAQLIVEGGVISDLASEPRS